MRSTRVRIAVSDHYRRFTLQVMRRVNNQFATRFYSGVDYFADLLIHLIVSGVGQIEFSGEREGELTWKQFLMVNRCGPKKFGQI